MDKDQILKLTEEFARKKMGEDKSGHDEWHLRRVVLTAKHVAEEEGADAFVVELAALLHDCGDSGPAEIHVVSCSNVAKEFLNNLGVDQKTVDHVADCVRTHSWSDKIGKPQSLEAKIIADCDALDAAGAVGICRTVQYSTNKGRPLYDPNLKPKDKFDGTSTTMINHIYEKLYHLDETMYTATCQRLIKKRIEFMKSFVDQFLGEWQGVK